MLMPRAMDIDPIPIVPVAVTARGMVRGPGTGSGCGGGPCGRAHVSMAGSSPSCWDSGRGFWPSPRPGEEACWSAGGVLPRDPPPGSWTVTVGSVEVPPAVAAAAASGVWREEGMPDDEREAAARAACLAELRPRLGPGPRWEKGAWWCSDPDVAAAGAPAASSSSCARPWSNRSTREHSSSACGQRGSGATGHRVRAGVSWSVGEREQPTVVCGPRCMIRASAGACGELACARAQPRTASIITSV